MELAKYKACICEGSAESAIIDILLDNDFLKMAGVKGYSFVKDYFSDPAVLLATIKKYHEMFKIRKGEYTLLDLLKKVEK